MHRTGAWPESAEPGLSKGIQGGQGSPRLKTGSKHVARTRASALEGSNLYTKPPYGRFSVFYGA